MPDLPRPTSCRFPDPNRRRLVVARVFAFTALASLTALPVQAHHEAVFGPQSALVMSSEGYVTVQLFTRQTGPAGAREQETTTVTSAGVAPFQDRRLSLSVTLPFSTLSQDGRFRTGFENAILGARYRANLSALARAVRGKESFGLVAGGLELPAGTLDHPFGRGAAAAIVAALLSVEKGPMSAIAYGFYRRPGAYDGSREGSNRFVGGGLAWTPIDHADGLLSVQIGISHETMRESLAEGQRVEGSGGRALFALPTVLYGVSQRLLFFGQTAYALRRQWDDALTRERYRVGGGLILKLGK